MKDFSVYGDSCYIVTVKLKKDSQIPLSCISEYYWDMRMPNSSESCIDLLFVGAELCDYIKEIESVFKRDAYIHSVRYFAEITCLK